ncbi:MAG: hypothetical protein WAK26_07785 [Terracidiphilus sp.]
MRDRERPADCADDKPPAQGPNLIVLYGLVVLALTVAIGFALLIVLPFFHRR